jgi:phosphate starvation-inducible protein PhoH
MAGARHEPVQPDPRLRPLYDALHARHLELYDALRPLFASPWLVEVAS